MTATASSASYDPRSAVSKALLTLRRIKARTCFATFIRLVAPWFRIEEVHLLVIDALMDVENREIDRLMLFLPPRAGKSTLVVLYLAWHLGRNPTSKILETSYSTERARKYARLVRDLIATPAYAAIFPSVSLRRDVKAAGNWMVVGPRARGGEDQQGEFYAAGVGKGIAGQGFNLGVIDDPHSEQDGSSKVAKDQADDWYDEGFLTRQQPDWSAIIMIMTRWARDDLAGRRLAQAKEDAEADQWTVVSVPAVLDRATAAKLQAYANDDRLERRPGDKVVQFKAGGSFQPGRMPLHLLERRRKNTRPRVWSALYQQNPVEDEGHILKRGHWRRWKEKKPPECAFVLTCYDTAFEEGQQADFTARTTWGVFEHSDTGDPRDLRYCVVLLEAMREHLSFPDLRVEAREHYKEFKPDVVLVEKRASGHSLIQELRRHRIPVRAWLPPGGKAAKGKLPRAHAASIVLEQGAVFYMPRDWADAVIDECADFPFGANDDYTDTCTMAWIWLRRMFWLELRDDHREEREDEEKEGPPPPREKRRLYG